MLITFNILEIYVLISIEIFDSTNNLGRNKKGPYSVNGVLYLQYTDGDVCPDGTKRKSSKITFICRKGRFVRVSVFFSQMLS